MTQVEKFWPQIEVEFLSLFEVDISAFSSAQLEWFWAEIEVELLISILVELSFI